MLRRLTILAPALALGACSANNGGDSAMIVLDNSAVIAGATACTFTGDIAQPFTSHGIIFSGSPVPYILNPLIESRITAVTGQEATRTIEIQGADVSLTVAGTGAPTLPQPSFQVIASGFVAPNMGTTNLSLDVLPVADLTALDAALGTATGGSFEVVASVKVHGLLGGDRVDAQPFQYGITVCNDCVVFDDGPCPLTIQTIRGGNVCNVFQDGNVDCCEQGSTLVCPGTK
jgi:hypothetical protein